MTYTWRESAYVAGVVLIVGAWFLDKRKFLEQLLGYCVLYPLLAGRAASTVELMVGSELVHVHGHQP